MVDPDPHKINVDPKPCHECNTVPVPGLGSHW